MDRRGRKGIDRVRDTQISMIVLALAIAAWGRMVNAFVDADARPDGSHVSPTSGSSGPARPDAEDFNFDREFSS